MSRGTHLPGKKSGGEPVPSSPLLRALCTFCPWDDGPQDAGGAETGKQSVNGGVFLVHKPGSGCPFWSSAGIIQALLP